MNALRIMAALLTFICQSTMATSAEPAFTFGRLSQGDELFIKFTSSGCFHHDVYEFKFQRTDHLSVAVDFYPIVPSASGSGPQIESRKERVGELILTEADIAALDRMLVYYRAKPEGACMTENEIALSLRSGGKTTTETLRDGSCSDAGYKAEFSLLGLMGTIRMQKELPNVKLK